MLLKHQLVISRAEICDGNALSKIRPGRAGNDMGDYVGTLRWRVFQTINFSAAARFSQAGAGERLAPNRGMVQSAPMFKLLVSYPVPYVCQFASPELVRAFIFHEQPIESDPRWAEYGAHTPEEYAYWTQRSCGVVCVKMAVEAVTACPPEPVMAWVQAGLAIGGYLTELRPDRLDRPVEKGWKHAALAQLARDRGCFAEMIAGLTPEDLAVQIRADRIVIASVSSELGEDRPVTRNSGHLVVVIGAEVDAKGVVEAIILHNPSGRTSDLQAAARIPAARFQRGFSGRGIVIERG